MHCGNTSVPAAIIDQISFWCCGGCHLAVTRPHHLSCSHWSQHPAQSSHLPLYRHSLSIIYLQLKIRTQGWRLKAVFVVMFVRIFKRQTLLISFISWTFFVLPQSQSRSVIVPSRQFTSHPDSQCPQISYLDNQHQWPYWEWFLIETNHHFSNLFFHHTTLSSFFLTISLTRLIF